ncbi:MAG: hypothetical protein GF384_00285, partial [Elusimicrobia bacterium]|nr:hypothetical protein [Elusimicrobiota bacterium]MBD3411534.1 hypothetical protein [Elusimicrobiota bacterium]
MSIFYRLAWRNIFRNKRRTIIAGIAIGLGLASLIFVDALVIGMKKNMLDSATSTLMGDAQIHGRGFRKAHEVEKTIIKSKTVRTMLDQEPIV